jgi:hypothetical protein
VGDLAIPSPAAMGNTGQPGPGVSRAAIAS